LGFGFGLAGGTARKIPVIISYKSEHSREQNSKKNFAFFFSGRTKLKVSKVRLKIGSAETSR